MMIDWLLVGVTGWGMLMLAAFAERRRARRFWQDWTLVRGDVREALVGWLRVHTEEHLQALDRALGVARRALERGGATACARRALVEADRLAELHVHLGQQRVHRWARAARTLATLHPLPPLPVSALQTPVLWPLAGAQRLAAPFLPHGVGYMVALRVQAAALEVVGWMFEAARRRTARDEGLSRALRAMQTGHDDLAALDARALILFDALLRSLPASGAPR